MRRGQCYRQRGLSRFLELRGETSRLVASIQFLSDKSCQAWVLDLDGNLTVHNGQLVSVHGRDNGFLARIAGWRAVRLDAGNRQLVDHRSCAGSDCCDAAIDRKSTRLNSSHGYISYAVFCLKKKKRKRATENRTTANKD